MDVVNEAKKAKKSDQESFEKLIYEYQDVMYRVAKSIAKRDEEGNYFNPELEQVGNQKSKNTLDGFPHSSPVFLVTSEGNKHTYLDKLQTTIQIEE